MKVPSNSTAPVSRQSSYNYKRRTNSVSHSAPASTSSLSVHSIPKNSVIVFNRFSNSTNLLEKRSGPSPLRHSIGRTPPELIRRELDRWQEERLRKEGKLMTAKLDSSSLRQPLGTRQDAGREREIVQKIELGEGCYARDVQTWLLFMEAQTFASAQLIDQQPELEWFMRPMLVDFVIQLHLQHRLRPETLYLTLNIVDRYLSKRIVFKKHYQLVGCVSLLIAAKFEDQKDRVPTIGGLVRACEGAYEKEAFSEMEYHILDSLKWLLGHPTMESWLRFKDSGSLITTPTNAGWGEEPVTMNCARFCAEVTLFGREYLGFRISEVAAAALLLARFICGKSRRVLEESEESLEIAMMLDIYFAEKLETVSVIVIKKYSPVFYSQASVVVSEWYLSGRRLSYHYQPRSRMPTHQEQYSQQFNSESTPPRPIHNNSNQKRIITTLPSPPYESSSYARGSDYSSSSSSSSYSTSSSRDSKSSASTTASSVVNSDDEDRPHRIKSTRMVRETKGGRTTSGFGVIGGKIP